MESFTYYQICYKNPVTRRPYKTKFIFKNKNDADFFLNTILKEKQNIYFVKEITIPYYTSIYDLVKTNKEESKDK